MIRNFFTHHPLMKIFSVLFAFTLWFIIRSEKLTEMSVNIPVRFQNLSKDMMLTGEVPNMIRLKLRGPKIRMSKLDDAFFAPYIINLEGAKLGDNTFWIYSEDFKVPFGVTINRIQPQLFHITLAPKASLIFP